MRTLRTDVGARIVYESGRCEYRCAVFSDGSFGLCSVIFGVNSLIHSSVRFVRNPDPAYSFVSEYTKG